MMTSHSALRKFPDWLRWTALLWLAFWFAAYWRTWGAATFVQLCDIAVILTCIGLWSNNALLISSQALSSLLVDMAWALDAGWRLFLGRHVFGGTEYLFDAHFPLWVRLLSLFHVAMPLLLVWAVHRIGYDRRALALQSAIVICAMSAARFTPAAKNMNFVFTDPFFHRAWGPAPLHVAINACFMVVAIYLPTHLLLRRFFSAAAA
ncbi:MAG: hypothetical protein ACRD4C_12795 [Candidatus Acidiferrales bacterium]